MTTILEDWDILRIMMRGWRARDDVNAHAAAQLTRKEGFCTGCAAFAMKILEGHPTTSAETFLCEDMQKWRDIIQEAEYHYQEWKRE